MTTSMTRQPRRPLIRWAMTAPGRVIGILRCLNDELLAAGDAIARSNNFPQSGPRAHAAQVMPAFSASVGKVAAKA